MSTSRDDSLLADPESHGILSVPFLYMPELYYIRLLWPQAIQSPQSVLREQAPPHRLDGIASQCD